MYADLSRQARPCTVPFVSRAALRVMKKSGQLVVWHSKGQFRSPIFTHAIISTKKVEKSNIVAAELDVP